MHRSSLLIGFAILLGLGLAACDSQTIPAAPDDGGVDGGIPPSGTGGTGGAGATGGHGGVAGMGGTGGMGGGACDNAMDLEALANVNGRQVSATCGIASCSDVIGQGRAKFDECMTECMETNIANLSLECTTCYVDLAWCAGACNTPCANSPCQSLCLMCTQGGNYQECLEDLDVCAGRMSLDCD